jgi:hypothetical protein
MSAAYPGGSNTFVPSHEASGKMVVDFSRNAKKFAIAKYAQLVPVKKNVGYYLKMTIDECARVLDASGNNFDWAPGNDAPHGNDGTESFEWKGFQTQRKAYAFNLDYLTVEQASWDILAQHGRIKAQQAMTVRTMLAIAAATTSGNYGPHGREAVARLRG